MAVKSETAIPSPKVKANPLIIEVPNQNKIRDVSIPEKLESLIEVHALPKPASTASLIFLPFLLSSFILSNIRMLASTAIPTDINHFAGFRNPFGKHDIELRLFKRRRHFVLHDLDPHATSRHILTILDRLDPRRIKGGAAAARHPQ